METSILTKRVSWMPCLSHQHELITIVNIFIMSGVASANIIQRKMFYLNLKSFRFKPSSVFLQCQVLIMAQILPMPFPIFSSTWIFLLRKTVAWFVLTDRFSGFLYIFHFSFGSSVPAQALFWFGSKFAVVESLLSISAQKKPKNLRDGRHAYTVLFILGWL